MDLLLAVIFGVPILTKMLAMGYCPGRRKKRSRRDRVDERISERDDLRL